MQRPTVNELVSLLNLHPLEREGGMYRETYRCKTSVNGRSCGSAIYFLMTQNAFSHLHRMETDEVYHFYMGDPLELLEIDASGKATVHVLGNDIAAGQLPQLVLPGGEYALFSTTMSPAFVPEDYENADGAVMIEKYPEHAALIRALTGELKYL